VSGLDYTIVHPTRLKTAAGTGRYTAMVGPGPVPSSIARADVARFILDALGAREYVGKTVSLGGRTRPETTRKVRNRALLLVGCAGGLVPRLSSAAVICKCFLQDRLTQDARPQVIAWTKCDG
jgi:hypothetical protein